MANQTIVFDPTAGVPVGANLTIYGGSNEVQKNIIAKAILGL